MSLYSKLYIVLTYFCLLEFTIFIQYFTILISLWHRSDVLPNSPYTESFCVHFLTPNSRLQNCK